jgi:hypothetical protein
MNAPPVGITTNRLAVFLYARADYAQAEPLFRQALKIAEQSFGPGRPRVAIRLNNLAQLHRNFKNNAYRLRLLAVQSYSANKGLGA